jgi:hypothetical protein
VRWAGYVAGVRDTTNLYRIIVENVKENAHLKDEGVDGEHVKWIYVNK